MKYKGKELIEANGADYSLGNTPRKMLVWDSNTVLILDVLGYYNGQWVAKHECDNHGTSSWLHAAEIPTEETLLTNRELAKWLAQGNGEVTREDWKDFLTTLTSCRKIVENEPVDDGWLIRKWDDTEWHKPTKGYCFSEENA